TEDDGWTTCVRRMTPDHDSGSRGPRIEGTQADAPFTRCVSGTISGVGRGSYRRVPSPYTQFPSSAIIRPALAARMRGPVDPNVRPSRAGPGPGGTAGPSGSDR